MIRDYRNVNQINIFKIVLARIGDRAEKSTNVRTSEKPSAVIFQLFYIREAVCRRFNEAVRSLNIIESLNGACPGPNRRINCGISIRD